MSVKLRAFVKGGCGCLIGFIIIALLTVVVGGSAHIDIGGALLLFIIGGIAGLVVLRIYKKGYEEGHERSDQRDKY